MTLARRSLFPAHATDIVMTYVEHPAGDERPVLHMQFVSGGRTKVALADIVFLEERGLPTDYPTLKSMFPDLRWSDR